jgi:CBS domain containing-hemolysin-like protein
VQNPHGGAPGVVHVRDTLLEPAEREVREISRPALVLTGQTPVSEALARMRETSEQLATVMDGDRFLGVVTVSDVLRRVLPQPENTPG